MSDFFKEDKGKTTVEVLQTCVPVIMFNPDALIKMQLFIENCTDEIGWLGTAYKEKDCIFVDDMYLFEQEVHSTTTEITPEGLADFAEALLKQENGFEIWNNIKVWGHSHVNMGVSPSGQDNQQMEKFVEGGHDWFIRIIANKKGDIKVDLYEYKLGITYINLPWDVAISKDEEDVIKQINMLEKLLKELRKTEVDKHKEVIVAEINEKVKKKEYAYATIGNNYNQNYLHQYQGYQNPTEKTETKTTKNTVPIIKDETDVDLYFDRRTLLEIADVSFDADKIKTLIRAAGYRDNYFSKAEINRIRARAISVSDSDYMKYYYNNMRD